MSASVKALRRLEINRVWQGRNPKRRIFSTKRANAKANGIPFSLRFEDVEWPDFCPVLGTRLQYSAGEGRGRGRGQRDPRITPSFDRIDPARGYEPGNVQIISFAANRIKAEFSAAEVQAVAEWMGSFNRSK